MSFATQYSLSASNSNSSSRVPSITSSTNGSYEEAFGALSSSYGFAGSAPSVPSKTSLSQPPSQRASYASNPSQSASSTCSFKNYEVALGGLYSSCGFGVAPVTPIIQDNTPVTRLVNAPSKNVVQSPRNYKAALTQLSSSYGVSGSVAPSWSSQ